MTDPDPTDRRPDDPDDRGPATHPVLVVVMGVSGTGKSTVGTRLAEALGAAFVEGDDHHPAANVEKMRAGTPLTDDDRRPWLRELASLLAAAYDDGRSLVLTCSALRRSYRDLLRGDLPAGALLLVHLDADVEVLASRVEHRDGHFMPATLLRSQVDTLEPLGAEESGVVVDVSADPDAVVRQALVAIGRHREDPTTSER